MIKELLRSSLYVVDERAVAGAILTRQVARWTLPEQRPRSEQHTRARSFRRDRGVRSFRLCATRQR